MPPRIRRCYTKKTHSDKCEFEKNQSADYKVDLQLNKVKLLKDDIEIPQERGINIEDAFNKLQSSPSKQNVIMRPLSFWSKKLKALESEETEKKISNFGLYEFSASESSFSSTKKTKKPKKKYASQKKKACEFPILAKKTEKGERNKRKAKYSAPKKDATKNAFNRKATQKQAEILLENKENDCKVPHANKNEKLASNPSVIFTSTPAPNKTHFNDNLKTQLNDIPTFMYLSPIQNHHYENEENNIKSNKLQLQMATPKQSTKKFTLRQTDQIETKCVRVLRNRKILIKK